MTVCGNYIPQTVNQPVIITQQRTEYCDYCNTICNETTKQILMPRVSSVMHVELTEPSHVVVSDRKATRVVLHLGQHGGPALQCRAQSHARQGHHRHARHLHHTCQEH